jgi:pimeloyl-ACP methyl ester carboxylesterase
VFVDYFSLFTPTVEADIGLRDRLRSKMGLEPSLERRETFKLGEIHYEHYPSFAESKSPLVVFLPGIGTYSEYYAPLLDKLSRRGFDVVSMDYPGHGYSGGVRGLYTLDDIADGVSEVIEYLADSKTRPVYLFGYSIGSLLAMAVAEKDARISGVICQTLLMPEVAPDLMHSLGWQWIGMSSPFFPLARVPLKSILDYDALIASHPAADEMGADPLAVFDYPLKTLNSIFSWRSARSDSKRQLAGLLIQGEKDEVLSLEYAHRVIEQQAHALTLAVVSGGHMQPWENPDGLVNLVSEWIAQQ